MALRATVGSGDVVGSTPMYRWPMMMSPMYASQVPLWPLLAVGIVGLGIGVALILWIARGPEDGSDHWRSHR
jgi:hypothetical protein